MDQVAFERIAESFAAFHRNSRHFRASRGHAVAVSSICAAAGATDGSTQCRECGRGGRGSEPTSVAAVPDQFALSSGRVLRQLRRYVSQSA